MKGTQVASGFLQPSRTVPVSDVNLAAARRAPPPPHPRGLEPVPPGRRGAAPRAGRRRAEHLRRLGERAEAGLVSEPALLDGVGQVLQLGGRQRPDEPGVGGSRASWRDRPIRPNAHPEGLSPNKDPDGHSGTFSVWRE